MRVRTWKGAAAALVTCAAAVPAAFATAPDAPLASWTPGPVPVLARMAAADPPLPNRELDGSRARLDGLSDTLDLGGAPAWSLGATALQRTDGARIPGTRRDRTETQTDAFLTERTDLPSYFLKERTVAPHKSPDFTVGLNERSSLGIYGEVVQQNREDVRNNTVRETRDLGAGISFQYKFDSR